MIGYNLSVLLAERGLNVSKVSKDTGLSRITLSAIVNNTGQGVQLETLNRLCDYLRVTPSELFLYVPFNINIYVDSPNEIIEIEYINSNKNIKCDFPYSIQVYDIMEEDGNYPVKVDLDINCYVDEENEVLENKRYLKKVFDKLPIVLFKMLESKLETELIHILENYISQELDKYPNHEEIIKNLSLTLSDLVSSIE
ncbi:MAG: helix-turn-helix transcriptional regulator [Fusobacterium necrophorum]|nr:helix-turn-helix transcriptional regulator [Fusobacterium necrophorum]